MTYLWVVISIILMIVGFFGVLIPFLPGLPLAYFGVLLLAFVTGFNLISPWILVILGALALLSILVDYLSGIIGARYGKASLWGMIGAITGLIVGLLVFGPLGLILGPAVGVLVFELIAKRDHRQAARAAQSTLISSLLGMAINAILAITFAITLIVALIF